MKNKKKKILALSLITMLILGGCSSPSPESGEATVAETISTQDLISNMENDKWVVVDTRDNNAFNGWRLEGVERGGRIPGATNFSASWLEADVQGKEEILNSELEVKGISPDKNLVLYDGNGKDAEKVATYLASKGYENLYTYDVNQWAKDSSLEMIAYDNYQKILPAQWIKDLIDGKEPETFKGGEYKIFEVSWGPATPEYLASHIPGAVHIDTDEVEVGPIWNKVSDEELTQFALNNGITTDTTVVLYSNGTDSMPAYRVAAILQYMGVEDVRVLNGGFAAWERAGFETESGENPKIPVEAFGGTVPMNPREFITIEEAKEVLENPEKAQLVDIRSWEEYIGETPGYSDIKIAGRIPGDVWGEDISSYNNIDGTMRDFKEILAMWEEQGIDSTKNLSFFCGTGWRVAEVLFYTQVAGMENTHLYDGGWYEWIADPSNPIETGIPAGK